MIADNGSSIAEAHFSENAWFRAIYADETIVGFIMLHIGSDHDDGIDYPGAFLWRFMIGGRFQRLGFGRAAIELLARDLKFRGFQELRVGYGIGEGSPEPFYSSLGFVPTGRKYGEEELEAALKFPSQHDDFVELSA
jgi:diamine N-acetyltransferase